MGVLTRDQFTHFRKDVGPTEVKILDEGLGVVEAIVSVTDVLDDVGDVIEAGAYAETLKNRVPKGVWSHDWDTPVAKTLDAQELMPGDYRLPAKVQAIGGGGLAITMQFNLATQRGREAYEDVKFFGDTAEWSIGYVVPPDGFTTDPKTGIRHISKIELFEYSPVLFGANPHTATLSVKGVYDHLVGELQKAGVTQVVGLKELLEDGCSVKADGSICCDLKSLESKKGRYKIRKQGDEYCVYNVDTGKNMPGGCHPTEALADEHMRALYVNVPAARDDGKSATCPACAEKKDGDMGGAGDADAGGAATDANPDPDHDGDDDRITAPHVFYPAYGNAATCRICRNPKKHSLHVNHLTGEQGQMTGLKDDGPGDEAQEHVYFPAGGPNNGTEDQPCLVCGLQEDNAVHVPDDSEELVVTRVPNETATDHEFDPSKTCSQTWTIKIGGKTSNPALCQLPEGHEGSCGPNYEEDSPMGVKTSTTDTTIVLEEDAKEVVGEETQPKMSVEEAVAAKERLLAELAEVEVVLIVEDKVVPPVVEEEKPKVFLIREPEMVREGISALLKAMVSSDVADAITKIDGLLDELMDHLGIPDPDEESGEDGKDGDEGKTAPVVEGEEKEAVKPEEEAPVVEAEQEKDASETGVVETKVDVPLAGSFEAIYAQIQSTLTANPPKGTAEGTEMVTWIEATYPDHVLVCATEISFGEPDEDGWAMPEMLGQRFLSYPYQVADGGVSLGDPTEVAISAVVTPKAAGEVLDLKAASTQELIDKTSAKVGSYVENKVGRTLSASNADAIRGAVLTLIEVLAKAGVDISEGAGGEEASDKSSPAEGDVTTLSAETEVLSSVEVMKHKMLQLTNG